MEVWVVLFRAEDDTTSMAQGAYSTKEMALDFITTDHATLWGEEGDGGDAPALTYEPEEDVRAYYTCPEMHYTWTLSHHILDQ